MNSHILATAQTDAIRAISDSVKAGGRDAISTTSVLWMALIALLVVLVLLYRWRRSQQAPNPTLNHSAKFAREMRRCAQISRAEFRQLERQAALHHKRTGTKIKNPLVLVLCPSLGAK